MRFQVKLLVHSGFLRIMASILVLAAAISSAQAYNAPIIKLDIPETMPALELVDEYDKRKVVHGVNKPLTIVHLWATWCVPCVYELPTVDWLAKNFKSMGLEVVSISLDGKDKAEKVQEFYKEHKIDNLPLLFEREKTLTRILSVKAMPTTLFVVDGDIIARADGVVDWNGQEAKMMVLTNLAGASRFPASAPDN